MDQSYIVSLASLSPNPFLIYRHEDFSTDQLSSEITSKKKLYIYKRHDKSLFELSRKFLLKHWHLNEYVINLERLTTELEIERRRLYDIINI